jgi:hypothetical protein
MRDITKYTIQLTIDAINQNENRIPIIADNPLLKEYPHGYYEPGTPPVSITPALAPTLENNLNENGSITDITIPELANEDYKQTTDENVSGEYVSQTVNPVTDDPNEYIEWFNETINGYSIDRGFDVNSITIDFSPEETTAFNPDEINSDEFKVEFTPTTNTNES